MWQIHRLLARPPPSGVTLKSRPICARSLPALVGRVQMYYSSFAPVANTHIWPNPSRPIPGVSSAPSPEWDCGIVFLNLCSPGCFAGRRVKRAIATRPLIYLPFFIQHLSLNIRRNAPQDLSNVILRMPGLTIIRK